MIVPRLFRGQFFTHTGTPPTNFQVTIRCDDKSFLQATNFLSMFCISQQMALPGVFVTIRHLQKFQDFLMGPRMLQYKW